LRWHFGFVSVGFATHVGATRTSPPRGTPPQMPVDSHEVHMIMSTTPSKRKVTTITADPPRIVERRHAYGSQESAEVVFVPRPESFQRELHILKQREVERVRQQGLLVVAIAAKDEASKGASSCITTCSPTCYQFAPCVPFW
jgi:hypothetical protein